MYIFDKEIIHDKDAIYDLGLDLKIFYEIWSGELEKLKVRDFSMLYDGELIFKCDDEKLFKKAVSDYKQRVKVLELLIKQSKYEKYVTEN